MHHYPFHPGDYMLDTAHLGPMEDLAYRRLLDLYYISEAPIPHDAELVSRKLRLDPELVGRVLAEFFVKHDTGWLHKRCDAVIADYKVKGERSRTNGKGGGRPKMEGTKPSRNPAGTQSKPGRNPAGTQQQPSGNLTKNQEPQPKPEPPTKHPSSGEDVCDGTAHAPAPMHEEWLKELESDAAYQGIPIRQELGKYQRWCQAAGRSAEPPGFVSWLNRVIRPSIPAQREGGFPHLAEVQAYAPTVMAVPECAERFWNDNEAAGWVGKHGQPIADWKPLFRNYVTAWKAHDHRERLSARAGPLHKPRHPAYDARSATAGLTADEISRF